VSRDPGKFSLGTRWWNARTGRELAGRTEWQRVRRPHAFLPDGLHLAQGTDVWNVETGQIAFSLDKPGPSGVAHVDASLEGRLLSVDPAGFVRIWDTADGSELHAWPVDGLRCAVFSPRGEAIATGSSDGTVRLWDAASGALRHELSGHLSSVEELAFAPDGLRLASLDVSGSIRVWSLRRRPAVSTVDALSSEVTRLAWSHDGRRLAAGTSAGEVVVWDAVGGGRGLALDVSSGRVTSLVFDPDGRRLATATDEGGLRIVRADDGSSAWTIDGPGEPVESVAITSRGDEVVVMTRRGTLRTHALGDGSETASLHARVDPHNRKLAADSVSFVAVVSPDGDLAVSGPARGGGTSGFLVTMKGPSVTEHLLPQAGGGGLLSGHQIWSVEGERLVSTLNTTPHWECAVFSTDGARIAASGGGAAGPTSVELWTVVGRVDERGRSDPDGTYLTWSGLREEAPRPLLCLVFSPDGDRLVAGGADGELQIWTTEPFAHLVDLRGPLDSAITAAAFSPDGRRIATGHASGAIVLWESEVAPPSLAPTALERR
jgi:WD40 repeat protein